MPEGLCVLPESRPQGIKPSLFSPLIAPEVANLASSCSSRAAFAACYRTVPALTRVEHKGYSAWPAEPCLCPGSAAYEL